MEWSCSQNGRRSAFKILTGKHTGKRPLGRPRRRWEDNIRVDLKEICINTRNWVDSTQDRDYWRDLVNVALNLHVPWSYLHAVSNGFIPSKLGGVISI